MFLLARDPFFYGCTVHHLKSAPAPSPKSGISLTGSVGSGGRNLRPDVLQIQEALNAIDPSKGGPAPKLAVDGICGHFTITAIGKFQRSVLGWADLRVDPDGPTLAALNAKLSDS